MRLLLIALPFLAAAPARALDCESTSVQSEMNLCAFQDWQTADKALNEAWAKVKPDIEAKDRDLPVELRGYAAALLRSQRAWLVYRDTQCATEGFAAAGGSMQPMLVDGCKARLTKARTEELLVLTTDN